MDIPSSHYLINVGNKAFQPVAPPLVTSTKPQRHLTLKTQPTLLVLWPSVLPLPSPGPSFSHGPSPSPFQSSISSPQPQTYWALKLLDTPTFQGSTMPGQASQQQPTTGLRDILILCVAERARLTSSTRTLPSLSRAVQNKCSNTAFADHCCAIFPVQA